MHFFLYSIFITQTTGLCDGLGGTSSSKAALMRQGFKEMAQFCQEFDQTGKYSVSSASII